MALQFITRSGDYIYAKMGDALIRASASKDYFDILTLGWRSTCALAAGRNHLYMLQDDNLVRADPTDGNWIILSGGWATATSMTSLGDHLYILQDGNLVRVDPNDGKWVILSGGWATATSITSLGDDLYIIQDGNLVRVDPNDGKWVVLSGGWATATSITSLGDHLYILQDGNLVRADSTDGNWVILGGGWGTATSITSLRDYIYILQDGNLVRVDPGSGAWVIVSVLAPRIDSFVPAQGETGTAVTITGRSFKQVFTVDFDGSSSGFSVPSETTIKTRVPEGTSTGLITATCAVGISSSRREFRVEPPTPPPAPPSKWTLTAAVAKLTSLIPAQQETGGMTIDPEDPTRTIAVKAYEGATSALIVESSSGEYQLFLPDQIYQLRSPGNYIVAVGTWEVAGNKPPPLPWVEVFYSKRA